MSLLLTAFMVLVQMNGETGSCLGQPVAACAQALQAVYGINPDQIERLQSQRPQFDVNGSPLPSARSHMLFGQLRGDQSIINIEIDPQGNVSSIELPLLLDAAQARTEQEFDRTAVADVLTPILPVSCELRDRSALYRFLYNRLRPTLTISAPIRRYDRSGFRESTVAMSAPVQSCGLSFQSSTVFGNSTSNVRLDNRDGSFYHSKIIVSIPRARPTRPQPGRRRRN